MGDGKRTFNLMENLSLQSNRNLHRFLSRDTHELAVTSSNNVEEEIELSLGLSLGGKFGVDKNDKKLIRSSSIAGTFAIINDEDDVAMALPRHRPLGRTASLPVETEEEWRKRKELQTLRRMAAKRRRSEKQMGGSRSEREGVTPVVGFPSWVPSRQAVGRVVVEQFKVVESQGGSSSGGSESAQGSSSYSGTSPASVERSNYELPGSSGKKGKENVCKSSPEKRENRSKRPENVEQRGKETGVNSLEDMPCVFTQGDGPNGRRIEGILYRYGKGEEVSIMCVCHGRFLSPAEFVEHAGITDVAHPLKHIVVIPSSNSFL